MPPFYTTCLRKQAITHGKAVPPFSLNPHAHKSVSQSPFTIPLFSIILTYKRRSFIWLLL